MANSIVRLPLGYFPDPNKGRPLGNAKIYVGILDLDPRILANQLPVFGRQESGTEVPLPQPIRTSFGGVPVDANGNVVTLLVDGAYAMAVDDSKDAQKYYFSNVLDGEPLTFDTGVSSFGSLTEAVASTLLSTGNQVSTISYRSSLECLGLGISYPDNGGGRYIVVNGGTGVPDGGSFVDAGSKQLKLIVNDSVNVYSFGAVGAPHNDSSPIAALIAYLKSQGGGVFIVPSDFICNEITIDFPYMSIIGNGVGSLTLATGAVGAVISIMETNNVTISGLRIDQLGESESHCIRLDNSTDIWLTDLILENAAAYGIGLQGFGTHKRVYISQVLIRDVGADGIDIKNRLDSNEDIFISDVSISRFALTTTDKAGIDIRGPVHLSNVNVDMAAATDITAIRFRADAFDGVNGLGAHRSTLSNFNIIGNGSLQVGISVGASNIKIANGTIKGLTNEIEQGVNIVSTGTSCKVVNVAATKCSTGFISKATNTAFANCEASVMGARGFDLSSSGTSLTGCTVVDSVKHCVRINAGAVGVSITGGGLLSGNPLVGDAGVDTIIKSVSGFPTYSAVETVGIPIDQLGQQAFSVSHGLPGIPSARDITLTQISDTNVSDYAIKFVKVNTTTSSIVSGLISLSEASATPGAVIRMAVISRTFT